MTNKYDWLLKKNQRSVDNLRLWGENPRLDPENIYSTMRDFAEEISASEADRVSFIELAKSIASRGFIPADPVVVWQNEENQKFYVAEGNRRVLALKLLRQPSKSPKSIRSAFFKLSSIISQNDIEKIPVSISPTFEDAEWYISQRNSMSSLQKRWSTEQQRRWIADLYDKYNGDINTVRTKIEITEAELQGVIRILKLKEFVREIKEDLTEEEYKRAISHTFPLTNLDRFFSFKDVREAWAVEFDGYNIIINASHYNFLNAFTQLIKRMLLPRGDLNRIDSRTIRTSEDAIRVLDSLPNVEKVNNNKEHKESNNSGDDSQSDVNPKNSQNENVRSDNQNGENSRNNLKNNPNRKRLICNVYNIETDSHKLHSLFEELKAIPLRYKNSVAASIRIFLDLAVLKYIETENLEIEIKSHYSLPLREIILKKRIEFVKQKIGDPKVNKIIQRLLNPDNELSLDVLNGYVHNEDTHYLSEQFLNNFWDFLFPLIEKLLVIKEDNL